MGFWDIAGKVALTTGKVVVGIAKEVGTSVMEDAKRAKGMEKSFEGKSDAELRERFKNGNLAEKMAAARERKSRQDK
ncbi:hypothetical protein [Achromobacter denitrificans]|uniref:hypothetical protein n=1 Tax=Achromobacter denitrificans TaxID=32002 RepID=UPI000F67554A|nr:hypothetical protein [Achromobacter denitrificans]